MCCHLSYLFSYAQNSILERLVLSCGIFYRVAARGGNTHSSAENIDQRKPCMQVGHREGGPEARSFDNNACNVSGKGGYREVWSVMMKLLLTARKT